MKVKLYAQPVDNRPLLDVGKVENGVYKKHSLGGSNVVFTEVGKVAWHVCEGIGSNASISLLEGKGQEWLVTMGAGSLKINLKRRRYKGLLKRASDYYISIFLEGNKREIEDFTGQLATALDQDPWGMDDFSDFEDETGVMREDLHGAWRACLDGEPSRAKHFIPVEGAPISPPGATPPREPKPKPRGATSGAL